MSHTISRLGQAFRPLSCPPPYSLGTALTGVGVVVSLPLGGIAGVCAVSFFVSAATSKKLKTNVPKHEKLFTVASSKREERPASKAFIDSNEADDEFRIITNEMVQYRDLKEEFARKFAKQQRRLNNPTLNCLILRKLGKKFEKSSKKKKKVQTSSPVENLFRGK